MAMESLVHGLARRLKKVVLGLKNFPARLRHDVVIRLNLLRHRPPQLCRADVLLFDVDALPASTSTIFGRFSYSEMRRATRNFSTRLGGNDKGTIFKGRLSNGSVVAIQRIETSPSVLPGF